MSEHFDVIIIGSGPAGTHAAVPLVEAGRSVCMLDGGQVSQLQDSDTPQRAFNDVRSQDRMQWETFLGKDLSAIPIGELERGFGGGVLSGNRSYATHGAAQHLPVDATNGIVTQSLAKGGFGTVWGAASVYMNDHDLEQMGLPAKEMERYYASVTKRIGISGPPSHFPTQPALQLDHHAESIMKRVAQKDAALQKLQVRIIQPYSAVLTQNLGDRTASALTDMEFYSDAGRSVYRPQYTLNALMNHANMRYVGGVIVRYIEETPDGVVVFGYAIDDPGTVLRWSGRKVIVAAGAINTARILLRSFNLFNTAVPFVVKPHVYTACIQPSTIGKSGPNQRSSLCQLVVLDETKTQEGYGSGCAQLYSYRSLLLFRLLGSVPLLPVPQTLALLSLFSPSLVVADIRFPAFASDGHTLMLTKDDRGERLKAVYQEEMNEARRTSLKRIHRALRMTGAFPFKTNRLPAGSSYHTVGTVPVEDGRNLPLTVTQNGQLTRGKNIYVADSAMFRSLPALPHTLTIMANAERIGTLVHESL